MTKNQWLNIFSQTLKEKMNSSCMNVRELSKNCDTSKSAMALYISGQRMPNIKAVLNMAYALDCDVSDLIDFGSTIK